MSDTLKQENCLSGNMQRVFKGSSTLLHQRNITIARAGVTVSTPDIT